MANYIAPKGTGSNHGRTRKWANTRSHAHAAFLRLWFLYEDICIRLNVQPTVRDFSYAVMTSELAVLRTLMGSYRSSYYHVHGVHLWASRLTWYFVERNGPLIRVVLEPTGEVMPFAEWPEGGEETYEYLRVARRRYHAIFNRKNERWFKAGVHRDPDWLSPTMLEIASKRASWTGGPLRERWVNEVEPELDGWRARQKAQQASAKLRKERARELTGKLRRPLYELLIGSRRDP